MSLHELLTTRRTEVIQRWTDSIRQTLAPVPVTRLELVDHLPIFLDELTAALRREAKGRPPGIATLTAGQHGVQRLQLGFNLEALVREYGELRHCIVQLAREAELTLAQEELDALFDGLITGIADAVTQYTDEREAEQRRQANEHFAFIAHELRNPLSSALLAFTSLGNKKLLPASRLVDTLHRSLSRMSGLIEHTLGFAFSGAGVALRRQRLGIRDLVTEAGLDSIAEAEAKGVNLVVHSDDDLTVNVDHRLALSALTNLIRNAVKFTHEGGAVEVHCKATTGSVLFEVADQCGGLPPGKIDKLFEPFIQGGSDRTGFGLGLSIAKQAAEAHGGSIKVRDLPGKGCVFVLELPAS